MNIGKLLSGAGAVAKGWQEAEEAQLRARELELRIAELNRLERLRQEMLQNPLPAPVSLPPINSILPVEQIKQTVPTTPSAPATPSVSTAPSVFTTPPVSTTRSVPTTPSISTAPSVPTTSSTSAARSTTSTSAATNTSSFVQQLPTSSPLPPVKPKMSQIEADRINLLRIPTAVVDVIQAPGAALLNLGAAAGEAIVNYGGRLANTIAGREIASTNVKFPRWSLTPFYDYFVRIPEQEALKKALEEQRATLPSTPSLPDPKRLLSAMIQAESGGRPNAVSPDGAVGLMQVKPSTAMKPGYGLLNIFDFAKQRGVKVGKLTEAEAVRLLKDPIIGAAYGEYYMSALLKRYNNNLEIALAAYNMGPGKTDEWLAKGADYKKLPKETRNYISKIFSILNSQNVTSTKNVASTKATKPTAAGLNVSGIPLALAEQQAQIQKTSDKPISPSAFYLANPTSIPLNIQRAMQRREELARLAQMYQRAGMGLQYMQARAQLMDIDDNIIYLHGMQGLLEFTLANDPRRLAAVWSQYAGVPIGIQPRTDGKFNIIVNGKRTKEAVTASEIADAARSAFDQSYAQQKTATAARLNEEIFKTQLALQKIQTEETAKLIRELFVEQARGKTQLAIEALKQRGYEVSPTGAGDGSLVITPRDGRHPPFIYSPIQQTIEVDGEKINIGGQAVPIPGLQ